MSVLEEASKVASAWTVLLLWGLGSLVHTCPLLQLVLANAPIDALFQCMQSTIVKGGEGWPLPTSSSDSELGVAAIWELPDSLTLS